VQLCSLLAPVYWDVPSIACLALPAFYRFPQYGALGEDIQEALISLISGRITYLWGVPGSGKDAFVHAYAHMTRTPSLLFKIDPGEDIESWFFSRSFNTQGTFWEEGPLLRCLRDGYSTLTGRVVPYLILISDVDRATPRQAESLRMVLDSIQGRVKGPAGVLYPVLPGTQVVMTANTSGSGDSQGRSISASPIDASILDRFERTFCFHWMDWKDESEVVLCKFPSLCQQHPDILSQVGLATKQLREAIYQGRLYTEFSHRTLCAWLGHASDILRLTGKTENLLQRAARCWLDKLPDEEAQLFAKRLLDSLLVGGMLSSPSTPTDAELLSQELS
jgi:hypothetical protein